LERERLVSPARLESEAREIGLQPVQPVQIETAKGGARGASPHVSTAFVSPATPLGR
jgi:hypothetical protein